MVDELMPGRDMAIFSLCHHVIRYSEKNETWGRILGRNSDKSLKRFPHSYSKPPLQLCLEISISSNSRNLLHIYTVQLLTTIQEKGGNPDKKTISTSHGLRNTYWNLTNENSQDYAQKPLRNVCSWNRLLKKFAFHCVLFWSPRIHCNWSCF